VREPEVKHNKVEELGCEQRICVVAVPGDNGLMPGNAQGIS